MLDQTSRELYKSAVKPGHRVSHCMKTPGLAKL